MMEVLHIIVHTNRDFIAAYRVKRSLKIVNELAIFQYNKTG